MIQTKILIKSISFKKEGSIQNLKCCNLLLNNKQKAFTSTGKLSA
jgi:hypothetical protein